MRFERAVIWDFQDLTERKVTTMKRMIFMLLMIIALTVSFCACSGQDSSEDLADMTTVSGDGYVAISWNNNLYVPYCAISNSDLGKQIGIVDGDNDDKVYEYNGYSANEWIINIYESGLMDGAMLYREINVTDIPDGLQSEYEWNNNSDMPGSDEENVEIENTETGNISEETEKQSTSEIAAPTKEEVLAMRETVLEGMSKEEIARLTENIKVANTQMEKAYLDDNIFTKLEDKESLYWNYFDEKGDIQIGWVDREMDKPLTTYNRFDAANFIELLEEMKATVKNNKLKDDLQQIIDETSLAAKTHEMEHANNIYKLLHDMDYYLLRYGLEDVGKYVDDVTTISKYYGVLSVYGNTSGNAISDGDIGSNGEKASRGTGLSDEGVWFLGSNNNSGYKMENVDDFDYTFYFGEMHLSNDGEDDLIYINPIEVAWEGTKRYKEWGHLEGEGGPPYDWRDEDDSLTAIPLKESTEFHLYIHPDVYEDYWGENCDRNKDGEYVTTDPAVFEHFVQTMFEDGLAGNYIFYMILDDEGYARYIIDYAWW